MAIQNKQTNKSIRDRKKSEFEIATRIALAIERNKTKTQQINQNETRNFTSKGKSNHNKILKRFSATKTHAARKRRQRTAQRNSNHQNAKQNKKKAKAIERHCALQSDSTGARRSARRPPR